MGTQAPNVPQIQVTTEHAKFKLMKGNRAVDYNHVKRLKREMESNPDLLASNPILVNEHLFIIDGQHRRMAAQELNLPVYYIISQGMTIEETRHLNTTQRRWTLLDFARSFADSGRKDYVTFLNTHKEFPKISPSILRIYLAGSQKKDMEGDFNRGEFQIKDIDSAAKMNASMAKSLLSLFKDPGNFDYDHFMEKLERENARALFNPSIAVRQCMRSIEEVYNFGSKTHKRLY